MQHQVQVHPLVQQSQGKNHLPRFTTHTSPRPQATEIEARHCHCPQVKSRLCDQSFQDWLTGLPNHLQFQQKLVTELALAQQHQSLLAVMFWDLDRFQRINQQFGYTFGDQVLQQVAERLTEGLRKQDVIVRWRADTFVLILPGLRTAADAGKIAQRLHHVLQSRITIQGYEVNVQGSFGIAVSPQDGVTPWTLLSKAYAALQVAKKISQQAFAFYTVNRQVEKCPILSLEQGLRWALHSQAFVLHYQPQLNLATGEVHQVEALLRWQHPELGLIAPSTFMAQAESSGLIVPIGLWVLRQACLQHRVWQAAGLPPLRIAVNLSARQLQEPDLAAQIEQILTETGLAPQSLELEITETAAMHSLSVATQALQALDAMGLKIALDDFGTGFSSLGYLKSFPVHCLKLDRSFIQAMSCDTKDTTMLRAMIALARELKLTVVAEGVETLEQVNWLRSHHCYNIQGYWFSRPVSASAITDFLLHNRHHQALELIDWQLPLLGQSGVDDAS